MAISDSHKLNKMRNTIVKNTDSSCCHSDAEYLNMSYVLVGKALPPLPYHGKMIHISGIVVENIRQRLNWTKTNWPWKPGRRKYRGRQNCACIMKCEVNIRIWNRSYRIAFEPKWFQNDLNWPCCWPGS